MSQVDQILSTLTPDQKIGQMLMFGWNGETHEECTTVSSHARILLEEFEVGGVVLLGRNVGTPAQTARTMNELQELSRIPLFIIADQEGGMVARFKDPFVVFPSNMALGATGDPELAYGAAFTTARQLRAVGVNFDFAPCVDVNNNYANPIIGTRSYGDNPEIVSRFLAAAIQGFHDGGVLTSAKHFPGHGDTAVDSHLALPLVDFPRERIHSVELPPFKAAIEAGVATIMTTHIIFPAYDASVPATMSYPIMTGLLREEMGFDGVVVTDDLEMKGVAAQWGTVKAAVECIKAGVDCPLICHTLDSQREAVAAIKAAVASGEIPEERIEQSARRVLQLKVDHGVIPAQPPADPGSALAVAGSQEAKDLALEISRRAVTVVRDEQNVVGRKLSSEDEVMVVSLHPRAAALANAFKSVHGNVTLVALGEKPNPKEGDFGAAIYPGQQVGPRRTVTPEEYPAVTDKVKLLVVATCPSEPWTPGLDEEAQAALVRYLVAQKAPVVVMALRNPYDIVKFPEIPCYLTLYGYQDEMLQAAAEVVMGVTKPTGKLPVTLPV